MRRSIAPWLCMSIAIIAAAVIHAGPLNPPAGPVASSYKTLSEVEPRIAINAANTPGDVSSTFNIIQPGGYYLTGNITCAAGKNGINVQVDDVSIDLNGFKLSGSGANTTGIIANRGSTVRNGAISGFAAGVTVYSGLADNLDVSMSGGATGLFAIRMTEGVVRGCIAQAPAATGIVLEAGLAENCRVFLCNNGIQIGIGTAKGCMVSSCTTGISAYGSDTSLSDCLSNGNTTGFSLNGDDVLTNCFAEGNTNAGYSGLSRCTFKSCASRSNAVGFSLQDNCIFTDCTANSNTGIGFQVRDGGQFFNCRAASQTTDGFNARFGARLESCASRGSGNDGIECSSGAHIFNCTVDGTGVGFALIRLTGDASRVEGNSLIGGSIGIQAIAAGNTIIRNSSHNVSNSYGAIVAGNDVGPIGPAATATSPWANIQY